MKRSGIFSRAKIERINTVARRVLLQTLLFDENKAICLPQRPDTSALVYTNTNRSSQQCIMANSYGNS